jgi:Ca2+-binding RTX toxin-like protein
MWRRAVPGLLTSLALLASAPAAARANVTAAYDSATQTVAVTLHTPGDLARIHRVGGEVRVANGSGSDVAPGAPLTGTRTVTIDDSSSGASTAVIDMSGGRFDTGTAEVAFRVRLGAELSGSDELRILGGPRHDSIRLGTQGIDLDAEFPRGGAVVEQVGIERHRIESGGDNDLISGGGGEGIGGPVSYPLEIVAGPNGGVYGGGRAGDLLIGGAGGDSLIGGGGPDSLSGGAGGDNLEGGEGDDVIVNDVGSDAIAGGSGTDRLTHEPLGAQGVAINLAVTGAQDTRTAGADRVSGIEVLVGTNGPDVLRGDGGYNHVLGLGGDDVVSGNGSTDTLVGGEGNDLLSGDGGDDVIDGGPGSDTAGYAASPGGVFVVLRGGGEGASDTAAGMDALHGIENASGSPYNDSLLGDGDANRLDGGEGNDRIQGGGGADALIGAGGDDTLLSEDDARDLVSCGAGRDTAEVDARDALGEDCEAGTVLEPNGRRRRLGVMLLIGRIRVVKRHVRMRLRCPRSAYQGCRGRVTLEERTGSGRRERVWRVGRAYFKPVAPGAVVRLKIKLTKRSIRRLRRGKRLKVLLTVTARDLGRNRISSDARVTLKRPKPSRRSKPRRR